MKIGILTYFTDIPYFNDINPGMNLQAWGVYQALRDAYPDAQIEFVRYHSWRAMWHPYVTGMTINTLLQDFKQLYKYYRFSQRYIKSKKHLVCMDYEKSCNFINSLGYDAIYVGSDTLLELFRAPEGGITAYWLSPKIKAEKYMMAASARDTSFSKLTDRQKQLLLQSIDGFTTLGIRDRATHSLISHFVDEEDKRLCIIPDPTFYYDIDYTAADRYAQRNGIATCQKPIVCFHLLKTDLVVEELARAYHNQGYKIASLRPCKYADFVLKDLDPMEFAGIFKYFKLTITHRFHDSVFNIKNLTPILLYPPSTKYINENGDSKQSSLLDAFGIKDICYIPALNEMNAQDIYLKGEDVIREYSIRGSSIKSKLDEYKQQLKDYVQRTK